MKRKQQPAVIVSKTRAAYRWGISLRLFNMLLEGDPDFPLPVRVAAHRKWYSVDQLEAWLEGPARTGVVLRQRDRERAAARANGATQ